MAGKLKDVVSDDIKSLIKHLTGFEECDDNFKVCERYCLSNVIHHRYLSVDSHAIRRSIEGIICKLKIHGLFEKANKLDELVKSFLASSDYKDHPTVDVQWALLSLLIHLANNPSGTGENADSGNNEDIPLPLETTLDMFPTAQEISDWVAYLREGDAEFQIQWSDSPLSESESEEEVESHHTQKSSTLANEEIQTQSSVPSSPTKPQPRVAQSVDLKQRRKEIFRQAGDAEKWCKENLQPPWWSESHPKHEPTSKDPSVRLGHLWHQCEKELSKNQEEASCLMTTDTISEHKVVVEVLWMLACPTDTPTFFAMVENSAVSYSVRPHITVASLTKDVFSDLMSEMCSYFGMIRLLQDFINAVFSSESSQLPPNTYYAYAAALRKSLEPLLNQVVELEKQAHEQESTLTLLQVVQIMRPQLKELEVIYNLHKRATLDWKSEPNWLCAIHLLAVVLSCLSGSTDATPLIFPIVIGCLQGYLSVADMWFATGVLEDSRKEFIIERSGDTCNGEEQTGNMLSVRPWEKELRERNVLVPEVLRTFASKMLSAGRDIEVLRRMDRWREIWRITTEKGSFINEVMECLNKQVTEYSLGNTENEDAVGENEMMSTFACFDSTGPRISNLTAHLRVLNDSFLDVLLTESLRSSNKTDESVPLSEQNVDKVTKLPDFFPLSVWLGESLISRLNKRCVNVGAMAANILIKELRLDRHVRFAQSLFLMQAGNILDTFCNILFIQVDREMKLSGGMPSAWDSLYTLSVLLEDCIDAEHQDLSSRCSLNQRTVVFNETRSPAITDTLDTLELNYFVEWPLTLVLSSEKLESYNQLFRLLLKLKWGMWTLRQMRFADIRPHCDHPFIRRVMHLRIWLMHVLSNSYTFLAGQILNTLRESFLQRMATANDLESIVRAHDDFLAAAFEQCLKPDKPDVVKNALLQMVVLADKLRALWKEGPEKISSSMLSNMEKCYVDCHAFLAELLRSHEASHMHLAYLCEVFAHANPVERLLE